MNVERNYILYEGKAENYLQIRKKTKKTKPGSSSTKTPSKISSFLHTGRGMLSIIHYPMEKTTTKKIPVFLIEGAL